MSALRLPIKGHRASLLLAGVIGTLAVSLYTPLMVWVLLIAVCAVIVRTALYVGWYHHAPSTRTINLLAVLSIVALAWFSMSLGLLLSMVNLLVLACALKLMMMSRQRDLLQLCATALFLIGCGYIFSQGIGATIFYSAVLLGLLIAMASYFAPSQPWLSALRHIVTMGLQAVPIAAILFLLLPQLPPLWQMPASKSTNTGLAEQITPGDIAKLSQSADLAFRATFENAIPPRHQQYWRAITLEEFDGKQWRVSPIRKQTLRQYQATGHEFVPQISPSARATEYRYQVLAEPSGQQWLFAIDVAVPADSASQRKLWQSQDYQISALQPVMSKMAYSLRSYPAQPLNQSLVSVDRRLNLQLPDEHNPQTQRWAQQLRRQHTSDNAFAVAVMNFFAQQGFVYTLEPDAMPNNPVDTFLFERKAGFCSHYAGAMAYALRLGGVPARVVTGYHGGESLQPGVVNVHQFDAHAWVEAWLGEQGWVRFDPTGVVSPMRLEFGLAAAMEAEGSFLKEAPFTLERLKHIALFDQLRRWLDSMDYMWSRWVLGFDAAQQEDLLKKLLGELTSQRITLLVLGSFAIIAGFLAVYFLPDWRKSRAPLPLRLYAKAEQMVTKHTGIARHTLGPEAYLIEVGGKLPADAKEAFNQLTQRFIQLRYRAQENQQALIDELKQALVSLRRALK